MQRLIYIGLFLLLAHGSMSEMPPPVLVGIETSQDFSPEDLVKTIFLKGECQNISNVQTIGNDLSVGYFSGGNNIFGFQDGILLSSGDIEIAEGPNESVESGAQFGNNASDPDMSLFATNVTFDIAGIEFDFVPIGETVTFRYVFASEEYCEFVGSIFNDVFGFFVSGPGINGPFANDAINVAVLPGTNEYVSINNVNHATNAGSYIGNELEMDANQCGFPYAVNFQDLIEYDGLTTPMQATISVIPCETYRIRLLVADVGDDKLDSGVFLESQSFDLGGDINVVAEVPGSNLPVAVEECRDGQFVFTRGNSNIDDPLVINFTIDPVSTAENGVDFINIPNSITIPPGETSATLPITLIGDGIAEGEETLTLSLSFPCDCEEPISSTLTISDGTSIEVENTEIEICADQTFTLGPNVLSGAPPYSFLWENGSTESSITTAVSQNTHYTVTVTDECGATANAIVAAIIQAVPNADISGDVSLCGDVDFLELTFEGNAPWSFSYSIDGTVAAAVNNVDTNPFFLFPLTSGTYTLNSFSDAYCTGTVSGTGRVRESLLDLNIQLTTPTCFNTEDGAIDISVTGGVAPYVIDWSSPVNSDYAPTNLIAGSYGVTITDTDGCAKDSLIVLAPATAGGECLLYKLYVPSAFSPNQDGVNDQFRFYPADKSNIQQVSQLLIFNRWGDLVYEKASFSPNADEALWDGTFKGKIMDAGIFVWQARLLLEDGSEVIASDELTLIR